MIGFELNVRGVREAASPDPGSSRGGGEAELHFMINGRRLVELIREHERPLAANDGQPGLEGSYQPLSFRRVPRALLYGDASFEYARRDGRMTLMGCGCGTVECWPLVARVTGDDERVVWDAFGQPFRRWDYSTFGPFEFDRADYDKSVDALGRRFKDEVRFPSGWAEYLHRRALTNVNNNLEMYEDRLLAARSLGRLPLDRMGHTLPIAPDELDATTDQIRDALNVDDRVARGIALMDPGYLTRSQGQIQRVVGLLRQLRDELTGRGPVPLEHADVDLASTLRLIQEICRGRFPPRH